MRILLYGLTVAVLLAASLAAQGAFDPTRDVTFQGAVAFVNTPTMSAGGSVVTTTGTQTLTSKTITAPVLSGSATGTYTLAGTPTITAPTITGPTITGTIAGNPTITAPVIATITNTGTATLPSATGGVPVVLDCGATGSGNQTCSPVTATALTKMYAGTSTLASNAAIITFPTAFNATTSYQCVANDITTRANPVQMLSTSTTTATITNTTGASDVINWICVGQ